MAFIASHLSPSHPIPTILLRYQRVWRGRIRSESEIASPISNTSRQACLMAFFVTAGVWLFHWLCCHNLSCGKNDMEEFYSLRQKQIKQTNNKKINVGAFLGWGGCVSHRYLACNASFFCHVCSCSNYNKILSHLTYCMCVIYVPLSFILRELNYLSCSRPVTPYVFSILV